MLPSSDRFAMPSPFIHDWVLEHARLEPAAPAIETPEVVIGYGALAERIVALAAHLRSAGVHPGDRVLVALPNVPAAVAFPLAITSIGGVSVEVNRSWSDDAIADIARRTGSRHAVGWVADARRWRSAVTSPGLDHWWCVMPDAAPGLPVLDVPTTRVRADAVIDGATALPVSQWRSQDASRDPSDPALVLYTSGSTGRPQGVIQTFANIDANTRSIVSYLGLSARDRGLLTLPLHYCYGRSVLQTHLFVGGCVVLETRTAFPRVVMETIGRARCTGFAGVPLTFELLRRQVDLESLDLRSLRYLTQAGGPMSPELTTWVRDAFRPAELFVMYGQTEATARLAYLPPSRADDKAGSIGVAIPGVELAVVDDAGRPLAPGEVGELVAMGPNVTPGYWDDEAATREILHDGWLWTGDLAEQDRDGFFYHRGRKKEIIKVGGHRVSPTAIENAARTHPDVADVGVRERSDQLLGEVPVAFVVLRDGATLDPVALRRHCAERLPAYEVPVSFHAVDALPRNEVGKLVRRDLPSIPAGD